ncbi:hypothetical protein VPHK408_0257 [Vibrio phage K408]
MRKIPNRGHSTTKDLIGILIVADSAYITHESYLLLKPVIVVCNQYYAR